MSEDGSRLLGAVLVGDTDAYGTCLQTMLNGLTLPEFPEELILPQRPGGPAPVRPAVTVNCATTLDRRTRD